MNIQEYKPLAYNLMQLILKCMRVEPRGLAQNQDCDSNSITLNLKMETLSGLSSCSKNDTLIGRYRVVISCGKREWQATSGLQILQKFRLP